MNKALNIQRSITQTSNETNWWSFDCLTQVVDIPTGNDKTLDLLFKNFPSPVNRVNGMPQIGKADHDSVYVEYDIKAKRIKG